MMVAVPAQEVEMIPVDLITVVNPRVRNKRGFQEIVANIAEIGLKRPITVSRRDGVDGPQYDLVCGQGRLEAFKLLGQVEVPALVVTADPEDCLIASLVENCARRQHRAIDLLRDIGGMRDRGYSDPDIARKTGLSYDYVHAVGRLIKRGEERLLRAVEAGHIPISVAVEIAEADDQGVQAALHHAYETKVLRGRSLIAARKLVEQRQRAGKGLKSTQSKPKRAVSSDSLLRDYQAETERKRILIKRSNFTRDRLVFIVEALRHLIADDTLLSLLEDEGLSSLPSNISGRVRQARAPVA